MFHGWMFDPDGAHAAADSTRSSTNFDTGWSVNPRTDRRLVTASYTSIITYPPPAGASASRLPVSLFTPVPGDAANTSFLVSRSFFTSFEPVRASPPITTTAMVCSSRCLPDLRRSHGRTRPLAPTARESLQVRVD